MKSTDLSIIVTMHSEGILLHRTLASINRAAAHLTKEQITYEIILHADMPTPATEEYLSVHKDQLKDTTIIISQFKDLGMSRNAAVAKAKGTFVTFIDADDLMSELWLNKAYAFLTSQPIGQYIAHTEKTIEFGGADAVVIKHGEINQATDTLLSVFANRWNSVIMAPRKLLLEEPYTPNSPGYGYEDWHLNCRMIARGVHNVLIPKTVIFVRRKETNSEWLRQKQSQAVLRANPLFAFSRIRNLEVLPSSTPSGQAGAAVALPQTAGQKLKAKARPLLQKAPGAERYARKLYQIARNTSKTIAQEVAAEERFPKWLITEWRAMHAIDRQVFPSEHLIKHIGVYDSLTPEHYQTGEAFKKIIDYTTKNSYDYIIFVPWLIRGGADLVAIHYANTIQKMRNKKNVLVIATLNQESPRAEKLEGVDFVPFGSITNGLSREVQFRLLEQLIENSGASHLHIINSELAYDFMFAHETYLQATAKSLILTSFSQSTDDTSRVFGYSHTHVPKVYNLATLITTDNQAIIDMWVNEYGFNPAKLLLHNQPMIVPKLAEVQRPVKNGSLRVLWAARLSPEKQPKLIAQIGELVKGYSIAIDMYGTVDEGFDTRFLDSLPSNVTYRKPFDNFFELPLEKYDVYLYTSLFDGMPNSVLEAAAAKLAIVASAVGNLPTFISGEQDGITVTDITNPKPYADALITLKDNPESIGIFSKNTLEHLIAHHSEAAYSEQIKAFLKQLDY